MGAEDNEVLEVEARLKDFISANLDVISKKVDDFGKQVETTGQSVQNSSEKMGMSFVEVAAKLGILYGFLKTVTQEGGAHVSAMNRVKFAVEETGTAYSKVSKTLDEYLDHISKTTNFSRDDAASAFGKLVAITGSYDKAMKLLPEAMDYAAYRGTNLNRAVNMLSKGTGEAGEKMAPLLAKIKGFAQADVNPYIQFQHTLQEISGSIGTSLLPIMQGMSKLLQVMPEFAQQLVVIVPLARALGMSFSLFTPTGWIVTGVLALVEGFKYLYDNIAHADENAKSFENTLQSDAFQKVGATRIKDKYEQIMKERQLNDEEQALYNEASQKLIAIAQREQEKLADTEAGGPGMSGEAAMAELNKKYEDRVEAFKKFMDDTKKYQKQFDDYDEFSFEQNKTRVHAQLEDLKKQVAQRAEGAKKIAEVGKMVVASQQESNQQLLEENALNKDRARTIQYIEDYYTKYGIVLDGVTAKEKMLTEAKRQQMIMYLEAVGTMLDGFQQMAGALKADAEVQRGLALFEITVRTAAGIMKAYEQGGALGFITGTGIAAVGVAQYAQVASAKYALGVRNAPSGMAWVGEQGPELMQIPGGTNIYDHRQSKQISSNVGPKTINVNVARMSKRDYANLFIEMNREGYLHDLKSEW